MPGVAAVFNTLTTYGESIYLYYTTQNLNLGLGLKSKDPDGPHENFSSGPEDRQGIIENPSHISAAQYLGVNFVVGITQPVPKADGTTDTVHDVSVVSPVFKPLAKTESINISVAISSSGQAAWVYFLKGTDAESINLVEFSLSTDAPLNQLGITKILLGSTIAAYYSPEQENRYIIYQDANSNNLYEYGVNDESSNHLSNSDDARELTAVAVTYVKKQVFVYYTNNRYWLRRIVKTDGVWGGSSAVDEAPPLDPSSLLTVTTSNNVNHLFYLQHGSSGEFTHFRDEISS